MHAAVLAAVTHSPATLFAVQQHPVAQLPIDSDTAVHQLLHVVQDGP